MTNAQRYVDLLTRYADAKSAVDAAVYMVAYRWLYGYDSAPYWAERYGVEDGIEQVLAAENH